MMRCNGCFTLVLSLDGLVLPNGLMVLSYRALSLMLTVDRGTMFDDILPLINPSSFGPCGLRFLRPFRMQFTRSVSLGCGCASLG